MDALTLTGAEELELRDTPRPEPSSNDVLIRVESAGICGSDIHSYLLDDDYQSFETPRVLGHEFVGTVVECGEDVDGVVPGDRVVEEPVHYCGNCRPCRRGETNLCENASIRGLQESGAFAEYVLSRPRYLHTVPETLSAKCAALAEPTSVAVRAVATEASVTPGEAVLIQGPGPVGMYSALVASNAGTSVLIAGLAEDASHRLPLAETVGLETVTIWDEGIDGAIEDSREPFDVVVDATGHHTGVPQGLTQLRPGGDLVVVGLPSQDTKISVASAVRAEHSILSSYCSVSEEFRRSIRLLTKDDGRFSETVAEYSLREADSAFADFRSGKVCKPSFLLS